MLSKIIKNNKTIEIFKDKQTCHVSLINNNIIIFTKTFISYNTCLKYGKLFLRSN